MADLETIAEYAPERNKHDTQSRKQRKVKSWNGREKHISHQYRMIKYCTVYKIAAQAVCLHTSRKGTRESYIILRKDIV